MALAPSERRDVRGHAAPKLPLSLPLLLAHTLLLLAHSVRVVVLRRVVVAVVVGVEISHVMGWRRRVWPSLPSI